MAKRTKNYINNKDFFDAIVKHNERVKKHAEERRNTPPPQIPDYIGQCFMLLAKKIASRPNFSGYSFKEEMIEDGIENCVIAYHSFNPEKTANPFGYFTKIIWFAFLRRIAKESKQSYIKHMSLVNMSLDVILSGSNEKINIDDEKAASYVKKFEKQKDVKEKEVKTKKPSAGIEKFIDE